MKEILAKGLTTDLVNKLSILSRSIHFIREYFNFFFIIYTS